MVKVELIKGWRHQILIHCFLLFAAKLCELKNLMLASLTLKKLINNEIY